MGQSEERGKEMSSESWHGWRQIAQAFQAVEDLVFFSQRRKATGVFQAEE